MSADPQIPDVASAAAQTVGQCRFRCRSPGIGGALTGSRYPCLSCAPRGRRLLRIGTAKRAQESEGCGRPQAGSHHASHVGQWNRVPLVSQGGGSITTSAAFPLVSREMMSLPGRWRWRGRQILCEHPNRRPRLSTLIRQRHLTPSCGGQAPTAERTVGPARILKGSLTPHPELENKICQKPTLAEFALSILRRELAMRVGWQRRVPFAEVHAKKAVVRSISQ